MKHWFKLSILTVILFIGILFILSGCKEEKEQATPPSTENEALTTPAEDHNHDHTTHHHDDPGKLNATHSDENAPALTDIIQNAQGWGPIFRNWYGQNAPNFTITDIAGKKHSLNDYRGKNVMLVLWATWCPPCRMEVPHLKELREGMPESELAIFAISYISPMETTEKVKDFAKDAQLNYTVFSIDQTEMPTPFNAIAALPSAFFIDKEGKIKLAVEGLVPLETINNILKAK